MEPIVIVGTGLAGYTVAREFRKLDPHTPLALFSADDGGYYSKPMLSNALAQDKNAETLLLSDARQMATQLRAEVYPHCRITALDPTTRRIRNGQQELAYTKLVLALGADPVRLPLAGDAADAVLSINDRADYAQFRAAIEGKRRIVILGGGLIGCEFANDLVAAGYEVAIIDIATHPLGRLVPAAIGLALRDALAGLGVKWHLGRSAASVDRTADG
ncbi:MAG: FAD-dependent oxidoreductase, partial [Thiohalobacteraceae bacterium]